MSEQDQNMREEDLVGAEDQQLDEFKASHGDPSEVPEPTNAKAKSLPGSKNVVDDPADSPSAVKVPGTKMGMINAMVTQMNGMKKDSLTAAYHKMLKAAMHKEDVDSEDTEAVVEVVKAGHKISSEDISIQEDMDALFAADESLSEEFKEKASIIFEAAVVSKINEQLDKYVVDIESEINEEKAKLKEEVNTQVDQYLDYVVENWMSENKLAVEKGVKAELTEDFINGLKDLFTEHYIEIPDEKVDVVEELAARTEELEARLNEEIKKNAELNSTVTEGRKQELFASACESLTETQKEKFAVLAEGVDFVNEDKYTDKLNTLKESYFTESTETKSQVNDFDDAEPLEEETDSSTPVDPEMSHYVNAISRTLKR